METKPENKKVIAGVLGIVLGWLGAHKFYLGYTTPGIIQLVPRRTIPLP